MEIKSSWKEGLPGTNDSIVSGQEKKIVIQNIQYMKAKPLENTKK